MSNQGWEPNLNTPTEPIPQTGKTEDKPQQSPKRPFWKRGWFLIPVAFFVGIIVGVTANGGGTQSAAPRTVTVTSIVEVPATATTIKAPTTTAKPATTAKPTVTKPQPKPTQPQARVVLSRSGNGATTTAKFTVDDTWEIRW